MGKILLEGMEFYAFHGCLPQEREAGNRFIVYVELEVDMETATVSDSLADTVNYANVYEGVRQEMDIPSCLLEHVGGRILKRIMSDFPTVRRAEVKISKLNPPMMGKLQSVAVCLCSDRIPD